MSKIVTKVSKRTRLGRKVKKLRQEGILPANIFGKKIKSLPTQLPLNDFVKLYEKAGETNIVHLEIDKTKDQRPCLISNVQINPVGHQPIHVDFHQVDLTEKVTAKIPIELIGKSPAVEAENAAIVTQIQEIEVEALPTDLPEKFSVDLSKLAKVGDSLTIADLKYNKSKIEIKLDPESVIVSAQAQQEEEEEAPAPTDAETAEETEEKTTEETDNKGKETQKQEREEKTPEASKEKEQEKEEK